MAGTYAGGYHGTDHEFFGSSTGSVAASHDRLRRRAERNIQQASDGGRKRVVSADGKRVLSDKAGPRKPARRAAPTTGPGAGRVGVSPTSGPGLGVVTPNIDRETGVLIPVGTGPGNPRVGVAPTSGPAAGVGTVGHTVGAGGGVFGMGVGAPDKVTTVWIGGNELPRDPKTSDAQDIEDAYGEGDFASPTWFLNWAAVGANTVYGIETNVSRQLDEIGIPKDQRWRLGTLGVLGRW